MTLTARGDSDGVLIGTESDPNRSASPGLSSDVRGAIRAELEMLLAAPIFSQSNRCKSFLSYIVLETIGGNAHQLKERTIGISVFDRAADYDTGEDSIVRVTANDVRKRLGQFYQESPNSHPVQIDLPRGSYVPEFRIHPSRRTIKVDEINPSDSISHNSTETSSNSEIPHVSQIGTETNAASVEDLERFARRNTRARFVVWTVSILLVIVGTAFLGIWGRKIARSRDLWAPFLHANVPVLICIDTHDLHLKPADSPDSQKFVDLVLYKQIIALDDAAVLSSMASVLGKKGIPFRVAGADLTSLSELRRQPVILIGAIDNKWTLRLTQGLRYRIEVANPPGSGSDKQPIASIVDSQQAKSTQWSTDLSVPFAAWKDDYAIVARMDDATTGVPVLIEAGLGNDGSLAASEFITSGALATRLADEPLCHGKSNFEAVIRTEIIDTRPGPPHVLRLTCW